MGKKNNKILFKKVAQVFFLTHICVTKRFNMEKMSDEAEAVLQKFKTAWIGKRVKIIGRDHPHYGASGECVAVEYTNVGWGIRIHLEDGYDCFCFKGKDIRHDPL